MDTDDEVPEEGRDYEAEIAKLRKESAKYRTKNKELQAAADRLAELENADKTEADKTAQRIAEAEARATKAEGQLLRLEVAAQKGLTPAQAKRLSGDTEEDLLADADEILALFGVTEAKPAPPSNQIKPNLKPAGAGDELPEETDPAALAALHPRR